MSNESSVARVPAPVHLWIIGVLAVLWNAGGAFDYLATQLPIESYLEQFTPEQRAYFESFPAWMTGFWALGVWGALFASIALLLRSRWAVTLYALSLVGMLGSMGWTVFFSDGLEMMGQGAAWFSAAIVVIGVGLLMYARAMRTRGVLR
ncbi:MAG: hypothetical protein Kow0020_15210 [Wenzhouxiangellaceae bacterium]